ncbi:threonylcarbamoyladenosine tRNA methylthiotransferase [Pelomyxa schiedti]|nr:threonylcarbamoyladenosine tRNA methylthiotransferase [Pelomyxa schiedti]
MADIEDGGTQCTVSDNVDEAPDDDEDLHAVPVLGDDPEEAATTTTTMSATHNCTSTTSATSTSTTTSTSAHGNTPTASDEGSAMLGRHGGGAGEVGGSKPGGPRVFLKTWGCSHNFSDSEYMAGVLEEAGFQLVHVWDDADIYVFNSCTVKGPSQDTALSQVQKAVASGKPVVLAGCVPQGNPKSAQAMENVSIIGVEQIHNIAEVVTGALSGTTVKLLQRPTQLHPLALPKIRENELIEVIPISAGCLNCCSFCKTKAARGHLRSWPPAQIIQRVRTVITQGVREIRITSEDTGAYGRDIGYSLSKLLSEIIPELPDHVMLRVGMTNPPYILEQVDQITAILNHPRVFSFLHIPIQSGSNRVLELMKRQYTVEQFEWLVDRLKRDVPGISIATDVICGFPTETDQDFQQTLALIQRHKFPSVNISQMYHRPGTPAYNMKKITSTVIKKRSRLMTQLFDSYTPYESLIGTEQTVWVNEQASDGKHLAGHTKAFVQVILDEDTVTLGSMVRAKIVSAGKFYVVGKLLP